MFGSIKSALGITIDIPLAKKVSFTEAPEVTQRRKECIEKLGDRHILKGGKYKPENGKYPTHVGQKF